MTEKIDQDVFRGIHFIRISNLPEDQREILKNWISKDQVIKIMTGINKIFSDCVQYHIYEEWYAKNYRSHVKEQVNGRPPSLEDLSLQK